MLTKHFSLLSMHYVSMTGMILDRTQDELGHANDRIDRRIGENKVHPSRPAHQSKKQMVRMNGFTHNSLKTKTLVRPAGFGPATSCLEVA